MLKLFLNNRLVILYLKVALKKLGNAFITLFSIKQNFNIFAWFSTVVNARMRQRKKTSLFIVGKDIEKLRFDRVRNPSASDQCGNKFVLEAKYGLFVFNESSLEGG